MPPKPSTAIEPELRQQVDRRQVLGPDPRRLDRLALDVVGLRAQLGALHASAPNPLTTRTPPTDSSTTVARSACSACTASTAGWIASENLRPATLTSGRGARATTASNGSVMNRITATAAIIARFDRVIGIITTKVWIWLRSLDERLISWPVCARSW